MMQRPCAQEKQGFAVWQELCLPWTLHNLERLARWLTPGAVRRVKLAAVYLSMTLLCLIMAVLIVRSLLALVTWVALGRCLWLFPYLLSEVLPAPCLVESGRAIAALSWPPHQPSDRPGLHR